LTGSPAAGEPHPGGARAPSCEVEPRSPFDVAAGAVSSLNGMAISFLVTLAYLTVTVLSTTDEQLLVGAKLPLPVLSVAVPIVQFFWLAPVLVLILHTALMLQENLLSEAIQHARAVYAVDRDDPRTWRHQLPATIPGRLLARRTFSPYLRLLLSLIWVVGSVLAPLGVLLWIQVAFVPYHGSSITLVHQLIILADVTLVLVLVPRALSRKLSARHWWSQRFRQGRAAIVGLLFLILCLGSLYASWFVAVVPDTGFEGRCGHVFWPAANLDRTLTVRDRVLSMGEGADPSTSGSVRVSMVRRDLRGADLSGSVLRDADLRGADLRRATLDGCDLGGAHLSPDRPADDRELRARVERWRGLVSGPMADSGTDGGQVTRLSRASLRGARLEGADLVQADLTAARLGEARFDGADLRGAVLAEAEAGAASFEGAVLDHATLDGADLSAATLHGARLYRASLRGLRARRLEGLMVDLRHATLEGASLVACDLRFSDFEGARLIGADLRASRLDGAWRLSLRGVDLRRSTLDGAVSAARAPESGAYLADLRGAAGDEWSASEYREGLTAAEVLFSQARPDLARVPIVPENPAALRPGELAATPHTATGEVQCPPRLRDRSRCPPLALARRLLFSDRGPYGSWSPSPLTEKTYYDELAGYLAVEACSEPRVALGLARRFGVAMAPRDPVLERTVARALLARLAQGGTKSGFCDGLAALVDAKPGALLRLWVTAGSGG